MNICGKDIAVRGGLIRTARLAAEGYEFVQDPTRTLAAMRRGPRRVDLFTFVQPLPDPTPRYPYPMEWENVAAVPVSTFDHWWTRQINTKTRNRVRRAEKDGVVVREVAFDDALIAGISSIYNESRTRRGRAFWHYGKSLDAVRKENATFLERSTFIGAFLDDQLIGFAKLVTDDDRRQAALMQILSMMRHRERAPTNALIAQAVRSCAQRGIPYLVYANFTYGGQPDSLTDFKHHNGFMPIELPRYYVPLTPAGRAALQLGLHHRMRDRIPAPLLVPLRRLRSLGHAGVAKATDRLSRLWATTARAGVRAVRPDRR